MGGDRQGEGVVSAFLGELALWAGDPVKAGFWSERAWELAAAQRLERDFIHAALLQGSVALLAGELGRAEERLHHALTRTRAVNVVEFELAALIAIAELALKRGDPASARASLGDVWEAAERGPYRLRQADAFGVLADIELAEGREKQRSPPRPRPSRRRGATGRLTPITGVWGKRRRSSRRSARPSPSCRRSMKASSRRCPRSTQRTKTGSTRTSWTDFRRRRIRSPRQARSSAAMTRSRLKGGSRSRPKQGAEKLGRHSGTARQSRPGPRVTLATVRRC